MIKGVDLRQLFWELDGDRTFDVIDSILVDEAMQGAEIEGGLTKIRTSILSVYNDNSTQGSSNDEAGEGQYSRDMQPTYGNEQTEAGFVGLEAPIG